RIAAVGGLAQREGIGGRIALAGQGQLIERGRQRREGGRRFAATTHRHQDQQRQDDAQRAQRDLPVAGQPCEQPRGGFFGGRRCNGRRSRLRLRGDRFF